MKKKTRVWPGQHTLNKTTHIICEFTIEVAEERKKNIIFNSNGSVVRVLLCHRVKYERLSFDVVGCYLQTMQKRTIQKEDEEEEVEKTNKLTPQHESGLVFFFSFFARSNFEFVGEIVNNICVGIPHSQTNQLAYYEKSIWY